MSSLLYLIAMQVKNHLLEIKKKPAKLILYLVVIGLIVGIGILSLFTKQDMDEFLPMFWFKLIFFGFVVMFLIISVKKGLSSGDTFFEMNDVNFLFVSPISPQNILLYGILRLTKISFFAGFFILFQTSSLSNFGIGFGGVFLIFVIFIVAVMLETIISLLIYSFTNGQQKRKQIVKLVTVLLFVPLLLSFGLDFLKGKDLVASLETTVNAPWLDWFPVAGWAAAGTDGLLTGQWASGLLFIGLIVSGILLLVVYLFFAKLDYYEDVLCATETIFEKRRSLEEGNINANATERKIKVAKTGLWGTGSQVFFSKHMRTVFRQNRFGFFGIQSLFLVAGSVLYAFFIPGDFTFLTILLILMGIQTILIGTGQGMKELYTHYIYLVPESSFSKILWSNVELVCKNFMEAVVLFSACGIILSASIWVIVTSILAYTLFILLLIGINYLSIRWTDTKINAGILLILYFVVLVLAIAPGAVPAFFVGVAAGPPLGLLVFSAWEVIASIVAFALSKGVLHHCDMPSLQPKR